MDISIRPLRESDLSTSDHIFRLAFGIFIGLPYPDQFGGDANYIQHRFWAEPTAAFASVFPGSQSVTMAWEPRRVATPAMSANAQLQQSTE